MVSRDLTQAASGVVRLEAATSAKNGSVEAIIGSLVDQVERAEDKAERWREEVLSRRREAIALRETIEALVTGLEPFAAIGEGISDFWSDDRRVATINIGELRLRDLRRAAALVNAHRAKATPASHSADLEAVNGRLA